MKWIIVLLVLFCLYQGHEAQDTEGKNATTVEEPKPPKTPKPPKPPKPIVISASGCPDNNWTRYKDSDRCYFVSPEPATHKEATDSCELMKSELIPPLTCTAEVYLTALLAEHVETGEFWIGLKSAKGDTSKWTTTRDAPASKYRRFWADGFPKPDGECAMMNFQESWKRGTWRNDNCDRKLRYVCIKCPDDFDYIPEFDQCIRLNPMPNNWTDAGTGCAKIKRGAHLIAIENQEKQELVKRYLEAVFKNDSDACNDKEGGKTVWIGGQSDDPSNCTGRYFWNKGRLTEADFVYTNWKGGAVDCAKSSGTCAKISEKSNYEWENINCETEFCSICEFY